jgi:hypothetical protein
VALLDWTLFSPFELHEALTDQAEVDLGLLVEVGVPKMYQMIWLNHSLQSRV